MISLVCIDSKLLNNNNWYGRFQLAPFRKSEGLTIANALRRTLLAEKSNFLISWVDFYNAEIPYSVLTGMRESIFDILLNLKQIILTSEINISQNFEAVDSPKNFQNNHLSSIDNFQWDRMQNEFLISKQREKQLPKRNQTCWTNNFSFSPFFGQNRKDLPKKKFILLSRLSYVPSSMQNREKLPTNQSIFSKNQEKSSSENNRWLQNYFLNRQDQFYDPVNIGYIHVKGPAIIYAKNLKLPKGLKCVNPDKYIVTLSDDGLLCELLYSELLSILNKKNTYRNFIFI